MFVIQPNLMLGRLQAGRAVPGRLEAGLPWSEDAMWEGVNRLESHTAVGREFSRWSTQERFLE